MEEKRQRQYDAEFKKEVLKMTMEGKPIVEVARDLGISPERIYKWRRDEKLRIGAVAFASAGGKALTPPRTTAKAKNAPQPRGEFGGNCEKALPLC